MSSSQASKSPSDQFACHWQASTADSNLTLHGFRRFKTTHLLNLRYLEAEIAEVDHLVYQLGLGLDIEPSAVDRLGLKHCKRDDEVPPVEQALSKKLIQRLRRLLREYDEGIIAFNNIMSMDTFALIDDEKQCSLRKDLTLYEMYQTRLLRVDRTPRTRQDPLQRYIHHLLRLFRYLRISKSSRDNIEGASPMRTSGHWSSQNTALIADTISRIVVGVATAAFLTVPIVGLSHESRKSVQMAIVSACIVAFACLVSVALRVSNAEMMVVSAAYAAIISVFVSNGSASNQSTSSS